MTNHSFPTDGNLDDLEGALGGPPPRSPVFGDPRPMRRPTIELAGNVFRLRNVQCDGVFYDVDLQSEPFRPYEEATRTQADWLSLTAGREWTLPSAGLFCSCVTALHCAGLEERDAAWLALCCWFELKDLGRFHTSTRIRYCSGLQDKIVDGYTLEERPTRLVDDRRPDILLGRDVACINRARASLPQATDASMLPALFGGHDFDSIDEAFSRRSRGGLKLIIPAHSPFFFSRQRPAVFERKVNDYLLDCAARDQREAAYMVCVRRSP